MFQNILVGMAPGKFLVNEYRIASKMFALTII